MKRSRSVGLVLMSATPLLLTACTPDVPALVYRDVDQCSNAGVLSVEQCQREYGSALREHQRASPRYARREDCERDFGRAECEEDAARVHYLPRPSGFVTPDPRRRRSDGSGGDDRRADDSGAGGGGSSVANSFRSQPLYTSRDDPESFRNTRNKVIAKHTGGVDVPLDRLSSVQKSPTLKRGGFGRVAASRGFGG